VVKWQQLPAWSTATSGHKQQQSDEKSIKTHLPQQKSSPKK
jgi:hypothetical protein